MAKGIVAATLDALTTRKGAAVAGVAVLGIAALLGIGRADQRAATANATSQAQPAKPAVDPTGAFTPAQVAAIQGIVKDYLISNPEVMIEVTREIEKKREAMQAAEQAKVLADNKNRVFGRTGDFIYGNPKGDVTVVEFFDYNCGWCKRAVDDLVKLTKADPKVRVVLKEFPIFGENSQLAAKAAMAADKQGKYWDLHVAMMREKQVGKENIFQIAEKVGVNVTKLKADMADPKLDEALRETTALAQQLNIEGTPGFIVDGKVNVGYVPADGLQAMIGEVRKTGCKMWC